MHLGAILKQNKYRAINSTHAWCKTENQTVHVKQPIKTAPALISSILVHQFRATVATNLSDPTQPCFSNIKMMFPSSKDATALQFQQPTCATYINLIMTTFKNCESIELEPFKNIITPECATETRTRRLTKRSSSWPKGKCPLTAGWQIWWSSPRTHGQSFHLVYHTSKKLEKASLIPSLFESPQEKVWVPPKWLFREDTLLPLQCNHWFTHDPMAVLQRIPWCVS